MAGTHADPGLDETRMSIGEHLEELRWHVLRAVITVFLLLCVALYYQDVLFQAATWPHRRVAHSVRRDRVMADASGEIKGTLDEIEQQDAALSKSLDATARRTARLREQIDPAKVHAHLDALRAEQADLQARVEALDRDLLAAIDGGAASPSTLAELDARRAALVGEQKALRERVQSEALAFLDQHARVPEYSLTQLSYTEAFMASLKLCLVVALFVGSPLVVRELWSFVSKGLYPHEKRYVRLFGPLSFLAFILGGAFGYFILIPVGLKFLISYASSELVGATIAVGDYLSLFIVMTLIMGAIFELPLVMVFTTLLGLTNAPLFRRFRRHFLLGAFMLSAILTPTPDPFTLCLMAFPLYALFELGIFLSALIAQRAPAHPPPVPHPIPAPSAASPPAPVPPPVPVPAPVAPPAPTPAPAPLLPSAPPPATVARGAAPFDPDEPVIGGEDDDPPAPPPAEAEEPPLAIGDDVEAAPGPRAGYFDPSLEEPEFERMGRERPPAPTPDPAAGQAGEPIGG